MSKTILAFDTSIDHCSISIYKKNYIYSLSEECKKTHTKKMLPMLEKILFQTKTKLKELDYIGFAKGPGSFTGLRIAAGIAQSLSLVLNIPIIGVSTLAIMAEKAWRKYKRKRIIVLITAKKTHIYWGKYTKNKESIWIGENTEILLEKKLLETKITNLKKKWTLVSNEEQDIKSKRLLNINDKKYFFPNARDIIPFILLEIKKKKKNYFAANSINYLYDF
ncbi:tRNA (adenosine(37)-N6)-threonylcarbamoyltransferase complex dimerization subunit type 1 TsaB [Buchnera aphidicola]|uniref:tRNA threonylcarbamoyladenosine biosynthesis protein TsaB n=1 Tax=Buchnera aphidicola (Lipaphis pseudobrassicae) TaxID=1258543 RepID=A0A4D6Y0M2_9GAMM|nr:tRNA (adenosine(37)-N6)-threonylcarbamoyltransferase complex dimerization subunit type 1 TsaB [Buchnera aphidicola]QCI22189.1 tRNA (adenosine(37)-N6)-threonylcarbamoyltransferase complex dimerization subunit type 1 TsaB [Buchnera aphidicola (Lipaphis pseudobrassicae)]